MTTDKIDTGTMTGITDDTIDKAARSLGNLLKNRYSGVLDGWDVEGSQAQRQIARLVVEAALAGRVVVDPPAPTAFADEYTDVKTWEPEGVDFQINFHPADCEKDAEVAFAYWQVSQAEARSLGEAFIAASEVSGGVGGDTR